MASVNNLDFAVIIQLRSYIIIFIGSLRQACQHINVADGAGSFLNLLDFSANQCTQLIKQIILQLLDFFLGTENFILELLKLGNNIALCVYQCLLTHKVRRHAAALSLAYLDIIAENLVEANLHSFNAGFLFDFLLKVLHPGFVVSSNQMQLIQLLIITCANHTALTNRKRRLIDNRLLQSCSQLLVQMQALPQLTQQSAAAAFQNALQARQNA